MIDRLCAERHTAVMNKSERISRVKNQATQILNRRRSDLRDCRLNAMSEALIRCTWTFDLFDTN